MKGSQSILWFKVDNLRYIKHNLYLKNFIYWLDTQIKHKLSTTTESLVFLKEPILVDRQGKFDVDNLHKNMKLALNKMGDRATIPLINYTFDEVDLDKIFGYLEGSYGQSN